MKIAVYLGSAGGKCPIYAETARKFGEEIAGHGHTLIFGGSGNGTMRELAEGALDKGGEVIGVMPKFMADLGWGVKEVTRMIVVPTMAERRAKMIELADIYTALPGGVGTLDEISEVLAYLKLHLVRGKAYFINIGGYYEPLRAMFQKMEEEGFMSEEERERIHFAGSLSEFWEMLSENVK